MPEGVEVKLSADLIRPLLAGKKVIGAKAFPNSRYAVEDPEGLKEFVYDLSQKDVFIVDVLTKGKFMYWSFSNEYYLTCTFGMTGQWSPTKGKHPCFSIDYVDGDETKTIYFNDPRHFGTIKLLYHYTPLRVKLEELGWDPLAHGMDEKWTNYVTNVLARTVKPIGQVMMDQGVFAGVGNYIRAEALYLAKMSPWRPSNVLKKEEILSLCQAVVDVMKDSYAHQGATILTYKDAYGAEGKYSSCFKVYGQKTDPLGNKIVKEETPEGRAIHWCPAVQV